MTFQIFKELDSLYSQLLNLHDKASQAIKESEIYTSEIATPAINELRNSYFHFTKALASEKEEQETELVKAIAHSKRAYFDAKEVLLLYLINSVKALKSNLKNNIHILPRYIDNYEEKKKAVIDALNFVKKTSQLKDSSRENFIEDCDLHIKSLVKYLDSYNALEEEINQEIAQIKKNNTINKYGFYIGIIGILISLASIAYQSV